MEKKKKMPMFLKSTIAQLDRNYGQLAQGSLCLIVCCVIQLVERSLVVSIPFYGIINPSYPQSNADYVDRFPLATP